MINKYKLTATIMLLLSFIAISLQSCVKDDSDQKDLEDEYNGYYENEGNDDENEGTNADNSVPSSIIGKYLHLYRSDGQKLIIQHLNSDAASIENQNFISYKNGYAPYYEYTKNDSKSAEYFLMWTPLTYIAGNAVESNKHYIEIKLSFDTSDKSRGTFSGTTWVEGWNWNTNTEYRKNEIECTGTFYLGEAADENQSGGNNNSDSSNKQGTVKSIEITSISDITSNSANIEGIIEIDGKYDEIGIICIHFDHSLEQYAYTLAIGPESFKSNYGKYCTKVDKTNFIVNKKDLLSNTSYLVQAYAIIGDKLIKSSFQSFETK